MNGSLLTRVFGWLVGAVIVVAGLVFTASLLIAVLLLGAVALVAAALRGEKSRFRFHWGSRSQQRRPTEVIDIEAREVDAPPPAAIERDRDRNA